MEEGQFRDLGCCLVMAKVKPRGQEELCSFDFFPMFNEVFWPKGHRDLMVADLQRRELESFNKILGIIIHIRRTDDGAFRN